MAAWGWLVEHRKSCGLNSANGRCEGGQQMRGKGVTKGMAAGALGDARAAHGSRDRALHGASVQVMAPVLLRGGIGMDAGRREHELPG